MKPVTDTAQIGGSCGSWGSGKTCKALHGAQQYLPEVSREYGKILCKGYVVKIFHLRSLTRLYRGLYSGLPQDTLRGELGV